QRRQRPCILVLPAYACESIFEYIELLTHTHMLVTPIHNLVLILAVFPENLENSVSVSAARRTWGRYRRRVHSSYQSMGVNHFRIMLLLTVLYACLLFFLRNY